MDDRKLEVFLAAVEEGSFNKTARKCHCSQSAVSQIMNAFEAELGCKVITRTHSGVSPTSAGLQLLPQIREAYGALQRLKQAANNLAQEKTLLRIGVYSSMASTWLPKALVAFQDEQPQVSFSTQIGSAGLASLLHDGLIDIALCDDWLFEEEFSSADGEDSPGQRGKSGNARFSWTALVDDPLRAVVPSSLGYETGQTITRNELLAHTFVYDSDFVYGRHFASEAESLVEVSADDSSSVLSMVASGMGVSILPELALTNVPPGVAVLHIDPPSKRVIGAVQRADAVEAAHAFVSFLTRSVR